MHSEKPGEKFSTGGQKKYAHCPKMKKENFNLMRSVFLRSVRMVTLKAILLTPLEQVPWKAEIFKVDVRQRLQNHFF